jgi:acetyl-CoA carboxylase carboxyl transferase subunit alpha
MALEFEKPIQELEKRIQDLRETARTTGVDLEQEIRLLEERLERLKRETYGNLTAWQRVQLARAPGRPTTLDVLEKAFQDFLELHGDRAFADDPAIVGGWPTWRGRRWWWWGTRRGGTPRRT